jgi:hypothetical protein
VDKMHVILQSIVQLRLFGVVDSCRRFTFLHKKSTKKNFQKKRKKNFFVCLAAANSSDANSPKDNSPKDNSLKPQLQREFGLLPFGEMSLHPLWHVSFWASTISQSLTWYFVQGILNGDVSLYHWPPVWLVWN